jgi:putative restriction endonuclease
MPKQDRAWLISTFGDDRQYAGNTGYDDKLAERYQYDSFVPNHKQLSAGDLVVLRDRAAMVGAARVARVRSSDSQKPLRKCPTCSTTGIKERTTKVPRYRCNEGHEFEEPREDIVPCTTFVAEFGDSFPVRSGFRKDEGPRFLEGLRLVLGSGGRI